MAHEPRGPRRARRGLTLVEVVFSLLLGVLVIGLVWQVLGAGQRAGMQLTESLEVNEGALETFRRLSKDVRESSEVTVPELAPAGTEPPAFAWTSPTAGTHRLELVVQHLVPKDGKLIPRLRRVSWFLAEPVGAGVRRDGREGRDGERAFSLVRREITGEGPEARTREERIAEGVRELVFFRSAQDPAAPSPERGPRNVTVAMRTARDTRSPGGRRREAYGVTLATTLHQRGIP